MLNKFVIIMECDNCCHWGARMYDAGITVKEESPDGIGEIHVYRAGEQYETLVCPCCDGKIFNIMASAPLYTLE